MMILLFIILLSALVLVHEWGHFIMAKRAGVLVEEFGFGFPPRLFARRWRNTLYSVNVLPFGGFVKIHGMGDENEDSSSKQTFHRQPYYKKVLIIIAGIVTNIVFAVVIFSGLFMGGIEMDLEHAPKGGVIEQQHVLVFSVVPSSPAAQQGIVENDRIRTINGVSITTTKALQEVIRLAGSQPIVVDVMHHNGKEERVTVQTKEMIVDGKTFTGIGISMIDIGTVHYAWYRSCILGVTTSARMLWQMIQAIGDLFVRVVRGDSVGDNLTGPIGIAVTTARVAALGTQQLLQFVAILSLNLALFNLLPIPALDGGRLFLLTIARLRGRSLHPRVETWIHTIGFGVLLVLVFVVTLRDLQQYAILTWFRNLFF